MQGYPEPRPIFGQLGAAPPGHNGPGVALACFPVTRWLLIDSAGFGGAKG